MIYLLNSALRFGLDLNVERQTSGPLRGRAKGRYEALKKPYFRLAVTIGGYSLTFNDLKHSLTTLTIATVLAVLAACTDKAAVPTAVTGTSPTGITDTAFSVSSSVRPASIPNALKATDQCSIDLVNDVAVKESTVITNNAKVKLHGWAADAVAGTTPKEVYLELDGPTKAYVQATANVSRPDVATHFNKPALTSSGWNAFAILAALPAGSYVARVIQVNGDGTGSLCDAQRELILNAAGSYPLSR